MTIKELKNLYQDESHWLPLKNGFPNFNYKEDDIVLEYRVRKTERQEIPLGKTKQLKITKTETIDQIVFSWKRR